MMIKGKMKGHSRGFEFQWICFMLG